MYPLFKPRTKRIVSCVALLTMLLGLLWTALPEAAFAAAPPATSLTVKLNNSPVATYTISELEQMTQVTQGYSSIDSLPAPNMTAARGVELAGILSGAGIDIDSVQNITFKSTDGVSMSLTKQYLLGTPRYFYPNITTHWDAVNHTVTEGALDGGVRVDALLALVSYNQRLAAAPNFGNMDNANALRLCFGQDSGNIMDTTTGRFAKWVNEVDVDGSLLPVPLSPPELTADSTDNTVGRDITLSFPDDEAWRGAISGVSVNGSALESGRYTVAEGTITIDKSVFSASGDYVIIVQATDYIDAAVTQSVGAASSSWLPDLEPGYITAVVGTGTSGFAGDGGPVAGAQIRLAYDVAPDSMGNLLIATDNRVRMVAAVSGTYYGIPMTAGNIYTVAGKGYSGYSGDGGPATNAVLGTVYGIAVDSGGNIYINVQYSSDNRIRKIAPDGTITTVAGTSTRGYSGDGGPAVGAQLNNAEGLATDAAGNIYIADRLNYRVRVVAAQTGTYYGVSMVAGNIYTLAGTGTQGHSGDGGPAGGAQLFQPYDVTFDSSGNLYICDNTKIRKIDPSGVISTIAGTGVAGYAGDGGPAIQANLQASSLALDSAGNFYLADNFSGSNIRRIDPSGIITTIAGGNGNQSNNGDGGPALDAQVVCQGIAVDSAGDLYITTTAKIRYLKAPATVCALSNLSVGGGADLTYSGVPLTFDLTSLTLTGTDQAGGDFDLSGHPLSWTMISGPATLSGSTLAIVRDGTVTVGAKVFGVVGPYALTVHKGDIPDVPLNMGDIITVAGIGIKGYDGDGGPAINAQFGTVQNVAFDQAGNLFIADYDYDCIRMVAAASGTYYGIPMTAGNTYTVAGTGTPGYSGDGGPATAAQLNNPNSVAVDSAGNLYISDRNNYRVRKVDPNGNITTAAGTGTSGYSGDGGPASNAQLKYVNGVAVDDAGNLYISDSTNHCIRMVVAVSGPYYGMEMTPGNIYTVAGTGTVSGSAVNQLSSPRGIALDSAGTLYIVDTNNRRVMKLEPSGSMSIVAGTTGSSGFSGDGGPATAAQLNLPTDVALDRAGNLYIADRNNFRVRKVDTGGIITTVAGMGTQGYSGDGGPATGAKLHFVEGVAVDAAGDLYIADSGNYCVRYIKLAGGAAPTLTADTSLNTVGQAVELTFTDDPAWRAAITGITVNGSSIAGQYTAAAEKITIDGSVFAAVGDYEVVVKAAGYLDTAVTQTITLSRIDAVYTLTPVIDTAYQNGATPDGISTMTVNSGVAGMKYFAVQIGVVKPHEGQEAVVFTHLRNGSQLSINVTKADFDLVNAAQAGFNVQAGDIVKVYMVDDLSNDLDVNPIILQ